MAKTGTPASLRGTLSEASTPVMSKSSAPLTRRAVKPRSDAVPLGTRPSGQTTDISLSDQVTESSSRPAGLRAQIGCTESGSRRQTA